MMLCLCKIFYFDEDYSVMGYGLSKECAGRNHECTDTQLIFTVGCPQSVIRLLETPKWNRALASTPLVNHLWCRSDVLGKPIRAEGSWKAPKKYSRGFRWSF